MAKMRNLLRTKGVLTGVTVAAVLLLLTAHLIYNSVWFQTRFVHPLPFRRDVEHWAMYNKVSPSLVAGVILVESKFSQQAQSHRGACGLMQIMPATAAWVAEQNGLEDFRPDDLQNPGVNIRLGTWYLKSLLNQFDGNEVLALAAYNAGRGNVVEWMERYGWTTDTNIDLQQLPYPETRNYVGRVLAARRQYQQLYGLP
ncbi:MAG: lytic transglycosylase domain-containing protein [Negativicutes bacterium]|nr:lytic transglycosylase domain-containing protein [Negativicutes bacterium]